MSKKKKYRMKKASNFSLWGLLAVIFFLFICFFFFLVPINIHSSGFWIITIISGIIYGVINLLENSVSAIEHPKNFEPESKVFAPIGISNCFYYLTNIRSENLPCKGLFISP